MAKDNHIVQPRQAKSFHSHSLTNSCIILIGVLRKDCKSLEVFNNYADVAPRDMISSHGRDELLVGLCDLSGLF